MFKNKTKQKEDCCAGTGNIPKRFRAFRKIGGNPPPYPVDPRDTPTNNNININND